MIKKTIKYVDFDDNEHVEDFYFNISKSELVEWEVSENLTGGVAARFLAMSESKDGKQIMEGFRELISKAVGERSEDGRAFAKSETYSKWFMSSLAYDELFFELMGDPDKASEFFNGVVPKNLEQIAKEFADKKRPVPSDHLEKKTTEVIEAPNKTVNIFDKAPVHLSDPDFSPSMPLTLDEMAEAVKNGAKVTTSADRGYVTIENLGGRTVTPSEADYLEFLEKSTPRPTE